MRGFSEIQKSSASIIKLNNHVDYPLRTTAMNFSHKPFTTAHRIESSHSGAILRAS
jgi:hypothetical protein